MKFAIILPALLLITTECMNRPAMSVPGIVSYFVIAVRGGWDNLKVFSVDYFNGVFAEAKKSSITPTIDLDLGNESGTGSPDASAGIGIDNFSIRWMGKLAATQTGTHTFYIDTDGIAGLWIDGVKIVDKPANDRSEVSGTIDLAPNGQMEATDQKSGQSPQEMIFRLIGW